MVSFFVPRSLSGSIAGIVLGMVVAGKKKTFRRSGHCTGQD